MPNKIDQEDAPRFDAIDRAVAILRALGRSDEPLTLSKVAKDIGLGQPTTSRYLNSLVAHTLIDRDEDGRYSLGIGLYFLGQRSLTGKDVRVVARPHLENLHRQYDETVSLALRIRDEVVVIDCIEATRALRQGSSIGVINPWHASSLGKSILARLPEREVVEILSKTPMTVETPQTLGGVKQVVAALGPIRAQKYAIDDEESSVGGRCVGAAIIDSIGRPIGAISISGPVSRITKDAVPVIGEAMVEAARGISTGLGFAGSY
jgi:IclR family acetate operon transcriptional repressor